MSIITMTRPAKAEEIAAEMDRRGKVIEQLEARLAHIDGIYLGAIDNLSHHQRQMDMDGIEVAVSRQALCEVLDGLNAALAAKPAVKDDETVVALPPTREYVDRIVRIFRDRPADDTSAVVLQDYARAALATKPAVKDDETVVDAPYGWVYFNEDTGTEWSESHPVTSGEVPDATEIRPCGENEKPWIDELRMRDDQLFHLRPLIEAARTFLTSPNIVKLTVNGKRMTPQEVAAALAAKACRS